MTYRIAPCVKAALEEATALWPSRSRASDGTIGDPAHQSRVSDHNPAPDGYVYAFDLTHDPASGCDAHALVRAAVERRDRRIKYVISQSRIWSAARAAEGWRTYTGENPHTKHAHVSVLAEWRDDVSPWWRMEEQDDMPLNIEDKTWVKERVIDPIVGEIRRTYLAVLAGQVKDASDEALAEIAKAVNDELARRQAS